MKHQQSILCFLVLTWTVSTCICSYLVGSIQMENKYQREAVRLDLAQFNGKTKSFEWVNVVPAQTTIENLLEDSIVIKDAKKKK